MTGLSVYFLYNSHCNCYVVGINTGFLGSLGGKESTCSAGDPGSIPGSGRLLPTLVFLGFPCGSGGKESTCNAGDLGSIPGLGKSPGEGNGNPL